MQNLERGYDNPYSSKIQSVKEFYFGNKDNPPKSSFQETPEAFNDRKRQYSNKVYSEAKEKTRWLNNDIEQAEKQVKSKINSIMFPNSSSYDPVYRGIGETQKSVAMQVTLGNLDKQRVSSAIEMSIQSRATDTLGMIYNYYKNLTPKNKVELEIKAEALSKIGDYFKPYKLDEQYRELQKIEAVKPRLSDLKKMFGLS